MAPISCAISRASWRACPGDWTMAAFHQQAVARIRAILIVPPVFDPSPYDDF